MKKRLSPFVAGMATMALLGSLGVSALAATGAFSITVNPINIQVNGEVFQPKDATGADVPVFSLDGTTYAPLRALAEAYGLEVGYDAGSNMATVGAKASDPATTTTPDTTTPQNTLVLSKENVSKIIDLSIFLPKNATFYESLLLGVKPNTDKADYTYPEGMLVYNEASYYLYDALISGTSAPAILAELENLKQSHLNTAIFNESVYLGGNDVLLFLRNNASQNYDHINLTNSICFNQ